MLALEVAASASSPRKRPTQIALIEPFSDCRIEESSVGSAKASRVGPIGPVVRSRCPGRDAISPAAPAPRDISPRPTPSRHGRPAPSPPPRAWRARRSWDWRAGRRASRAPSRRPRRPWRGGRCSAAMSITPSSGRMKVASSTTICAAPPGGCAVARSLSIRASRCERGGVALEPRRRLPRRRRGHAAAASRPAARSARPGRRGCR